MVIISAEYVISSPSVDKAPPPDRPEYAFLGRSNVGKSSLINMICDRKHLAKTSGTPGKTQLINHFDIVSGNHEKWYLVDLPGYGFAKVSQSQRKSWQKMIGDYITKRENLVNLFLLIDSRHEPQQLDIDFVNKLGKDSVPFALVFTKTDKITQKEAAANVRKFLDELSRFWETLPLHFVTSALKRTGRKQLLDFISNMNKEVAEPIRQQYFNRPREQKNPLDKPNV